MKTRSVVRNRGWLAAVGLTCSLAGCGGGSGGGFDGEKAPYGPRTPTTRTQAVVTVASGGVVPATTASATTAVVGQKTIGGVTYDRLATTRADNPNQGGEYWIKENGDGTVDFGGFMHTELLSGFLPAASTVFTTPVKLKLDPPVGQPQPVATAAAVGVGGSATPASASFAGQYTLIDKDASVATGVGELAGCKHYTGAATSDSAEIPALLKGQAIAAELWYHPDYGVVAFSAPSLGLGTAMSGTDDCGAVDADGHRIIRKMGVVDASSSLNLDSYECDGQRIAADKNTHAAMLLELRWVDEAAAKTDLQPGPAVEFGTTIGIFGNIVAESPASVFHPEENGKGYKYWYSYVNQAAKNEPGDDSTTYHIKVTGRAGVAPVRVTARIYYKVLTSHLGPGIDGAVPAGGGGSIGSGGAIGIDGGLGGAGGGIRIDGAAGAGGAIGIDASRDIPIATGGTGIDGGRDVAADFPNTPTPDGGVLVIPPGTPTISTVFDTLPTTTTTWIPIQAAGGDFAKFATVSAGRLVIDVPAGNSWGKTGVRSKDPIFEVTADMTTSPWSVLVDLDPAATSGAVVVLSPTAYDDIWTSQNFWMAWIRHPLAGGTSANIVNTQNTADTSKTLTNTPLTAPGTVAVVARPGQVQGCTSSGWGMEGSYAWMTAGTKVYAYVFSHAYDAGMPTKLAVKSIKVVRGAACGNAGAIPAYTAAPEAAVFADDLAGGIAKNWTPIQAAGGDYTKFATTPSGELFVNVPAGNNWGKTGVRSTYFMFDVRDDMATVPLSLAFDFVPARTSGFALVLSPTVTDDIWTSENFWAAFVRHPTAAGASANIVNTQNTADSSKSLPNIPSDAPGTVTLAVRPGHVQVCTSAGWGMEGDYAWMKAGTKVTAYVFSHPYDSGMPVQMDLTNVHADRVAACGATGTIPAYPAPARRVLFQDTFAGGYAQNWTGIQAAGGNFTTFAVNTTNEVYVSVPAGNSWGKTGIRSSYYLFDVRSDYATAPMTLDFAIDPARTSGFVIALSTTAYDDIWTSENVWMAFIIDPDTGLAEFDLSNTQNATDTSIAKSAQAIAMPSKVSLTITPKHMKATLSSGQVIEGDYKWLDVGKPVYAYVFSHPIREGLASSVALKSVTASR
jgi:hypothetical protein